MSEPAIPWVGAQPLDLIGREEELNKMRQAVSQPGSACRIVLIKGEGGVGKSRLANAMLQHLGVQVEIDDQVPIPESMRWGELAGKMMATGLIDLAETKLQTQAYFLSRLAEPSTWFAPTSGERQERLFFAEFESAGREWQRLSDLGIAFTAVKKAAQKAEEAFWRDYQRLTAKRRAVITLDTAEQLFISSQWMIDAGLLQPDDVMFHTQRWLLAQIRQGRLANTTLFIVSRSREGQAFIELLQEAAAKTPNCEWLPISLEPFNHAEIKQYLEALAGDLRLEESLRSYLKAVIGDADRLKVLNLYTGGQPIRLALYVDVLLAGAVVPEELQESYAEALARTGWREGLDKTEEEKLLQPARQIIEREFSQALFSRPDESLSTQILQLLVRCPRGLTAEQIHFVLDSPPETKVSDWQADAAHLQEIRVVMDQLRRLIIVKSRDNGRLLYLQDEMYRICDESMALNEADHQAEVEARTWLYKKLRDWAAYHRRALQEERSNWVRRIIEHIRPERWSRVSAIRFPTPPAVEERQLNILEVMLFEAEQEYLHYEILLDPQENFNDTYYDLVNRHEWAYREDRITVLQTEVDRLIRTEHLMRLRPWKSRGAIKAREEEPYDVLKRVVKTDEAIKWILRFFLRKEYNRAIELSEALEKTYIPTISDAYERNSWLHTLNQTERTCYYEFARIYSGQNRLEAIESLRKLVAPNAPLVKLGQMNDEEILDETGEHGFLGHPAHTRLLFVLAISWNVVGYGYATLGFFRNAVAAYTTSLMYTRLVPPLFMIGSHASTINNLARALSEIGRWHAVRLCYDGLDRHIEMGEWVPISLSYNTLGLIHNDFKEPEEALEYSAVALAIARHMQNERAVALSLLQVGEALRSLVTGGAFPMRDPEEEMFREAGNVLMQAYEIFQKGNEPVRLAEAALELGSFYRDRAEHARKKGNDEWKRWAENAEHYLQEAVDIANAHAYDHLALDAWVSLTVVYYHKGQPAFITDTILPEVKKLVPEDSPARLLPDQAPPKPTEHPAFIFKQLSKLHEILGRVAFNAFLAQMADLRQTEPDWLERRERFQTDEALQANLKKASEEYILAVTYGQLYSPGSATLSHVYDQLHSYLKRMNFWEISKFYEFERVMVKRYRVGEIRFDQPGELADFLWSSFGDYSGEHDELMAKLVQTREGGHGRS